MSFPFLAPSPWERAGVRSGSPETRNPSGDTFKSSNSQIFKSSNQFFNPSTLQNIFLLLGKNNHMALTYLGLGTNLGNKQKNLNDAIIALSIGAGNVLAVSSFVHSEPLGFASENQFLNAVVLFETTLSPFQLLEKTQEIERSLGRTAKSVTGYSDRIIDIDILLYDNELVDQPTLKIPHPKMTERDFVLIPLLELAPDLAHPATGIKFRDYKL